MAAQKAAGANFVIIKATESTSFIDPNFSANYDSATSAGLIRGAYHFARPDESDGASQANYFLAHGGGWTGDGITLPGMLDIEYGPSGNTCYGLGAADMVSWIHSFGDTYKSAVGRPPMIYTTFDWWNTCTGNDGSFGDYPLVIANYNDAITDVPAGMFASFWQFADSGTFPGDQDRWLGSADDLKKFATVAG